MRRKRNISSLHRRLAWLLRECRIALEIEVQVGPFSLDCYSRPLNLGFEADGPCHGRRRSKDKRRDRYLVKHFGIHVVRLNARQLRNSVLAKIEILRAVRRYSQVRNPLAEEVI